MKNYYFTPSIIILLLCLKKKLFFLYIILFSAISTRLAPTRTPGNGEVLKQRRCLILFWPIFQLLFLLLLLPLPRYLNPTLAPALTPTPFPTQIPESREITLDRHPELGFGFVAGSEKPVIVRWGAGAGAGTEREESMNKTLRFVTGGYPGVDKLMPENQILSINGEDVAR